MEWYVLSWNIYFFVYIYTYIVMYLVLRVGRALYDLFFAYFSESALTHEISSLKTTAARLKFKGIDGGLHKRWSMWFNSKQRAEPYQSLQYIENICYEVYFDIQALHGCRQFVAWAVGLSPRTNATLLARVKQSVLDLVRLPVTYGRKVRMTSSPHGPYGLGYTRATMANTKGSNMATWSKSSTFVVVRIVLCNSRTWSWNR